MCYVVREGKDNDDHPTAAHMSRMACTMSSDDVDQCRLKKENMGSDENILSSFRDRQKQPKNIPRDGKRYSS